MCQFISWKEYKGKSYFLTDTDLNTKEGRELLKPEYKTDIKGHGAIEHYYPELKGKGYDKECTDFSTPANFPKEIVKAIKEGRFVNFGVCEQILNEKGKAEYLKTKKPAWAEYLKIEQPAYAKYEKIKQSAWAEYLNIEQLVYTKYLKIQQPAYDEYLKTIHTEFWKIARQKKYRSKAWK